MLPREPCKVQDTMNKPPIIGLYSPIPLCGKDTMARHLARYGYANVKTSATMKAMLAVLYRALGYTEEEIVEMQDGPRRHLIELFPAETYKVPSESMGFVEVTKPAVTARDVQLTLGTEWGRQRVNYNLWTTVLRRTLERSVRAGVQTVVTDVRFPNEVAVIRSLGGELWRVERPQAPQPTEKHPSDYGLEDERFDLRIRNAGTVIALEAAIDAYLNKA